MTPAEAAVSAQDSMRVLTWNVNGIRSVVAKMGTVKAVLDSLNADIICLQETKIRRSELDRELAIVEGWESFWVFSTNRTGPGYAGVATFCRTSTASVPVAVEHGLTGTAAASNPGKPEAITSSSGSVSDTSLQLSQTLGLDVEQLAALDSEGRALITDHGPFLVVNLYGPALTSEERVEERLPFKLNFYGVLEWRVRQWLAAGRAVLVVGDLNISPQPIDSCKPHPIAEFERRPDRVWLNKLLGPHGPGVEDVFRRVHPNRTDAYTCWNVASGARVHNYGTRIDHILAAGLMPEPLTAAHSSHGQHGRDSNQQLNSLASGSTDRAVAMSMRAAAAEATYLAAQQVATAKEVAAASFATLVTGCDIMHDFQGSDHAPVWADLAIPLHVMPSGHAVPAAAASRMFPGKQASLKAWLQPKQQQPRGVQLDIVNVHLQHQHSVQEQSMQLGKQTTARCATGVSGQAMSALQQGSMLSRSRSPHLLRDSRLGKRQSNSQLAGSNKRGQTSLLGFMSQSAVQQLGADGVCSSKGSKGSNSSSSHIQATGSAPVEQQQPATGALASQAQRKQMHGPAASDDTAGEIEDKFSQQQQCALSQQSQRHQASSMWPGRIGQQQQQSSLQLEQQQQQHLPQIQHEQLRQQGTEQQGAAAEDAPASLQVALADQRKHAKAAWQRISQAMRPPKCSHGEASVVRTCKKQNENFLRQFYCCARPDGPFPGPGRCNFFKWVTEPKKTKGVERAAAAAARKSTS